VLEDAIWIEMGLCAVSIRLYYRNITYELTEKRRLSLRSQCKTKRRHAIVEKQRAFF